MTIDAISLQQQLQKIKIDADNLLTGLSDAQFNWRPEPHIWSMAQCFVHLNIFGREYYPLITEKVIAAERANLMGVGNYKLSLFGKLFLKLTEPPVKTKVKAPKIFQPWPDSPLAPTREEFQCLQTETITLIARAEKLNWTKIKVNSPATKLLKFNLTEILAIFAAHERRHLWQASQLRHHTNFPA